jgi:archaeal flagellin N-terminal-like domain
MRSRRSISDIVAVVLLIVIAIAAAVIIYMWLSGLMGSMHTSTSITQTKLEITGANVTYNTAKHGFNVTAYVYNPPGSPSTSITLGELEFTNGTLICSTKQVLPSTIAPTNSTYVKFSCGYSSAVPAGTPVEIILVTSEGVQVTYTTTVS